VNDTELAALTTAIDTEDIETQCSVIPEDAPGRFELILAVRACRRVRESAADVIALAAEGRITDAVNGTHEVERHLTRMVNVLVGARQAGAR
jgi:hypothetical protein